MDILYGISILTFLTCFLCGQPVQVAGTSNGNSPKTGYRRRATQDSWDSLPDVLKVRHPPGKRHMDANSFVGNIPAMAHISGENTVFKDIEVEDLFEEGDIYVGPKVQRNAIVYESSLWPGGVVPYEIDSAFDSGSRSRIQEAITQYHTHTCIKFVPRTTQADYLYIYPSSGCWSSIGRTGGRQTLSLGSGCTHHRVTPMHEFMHAVGFAHEQSRTDRDNYVTIYWQNIADSMEYNFEKHGTDYIKDLGARYDYFSIMHYHHTAFSINGQSTILPTQSGVSAEDLGSSRDFTETDIFKLNKLYNCGGGGGGGGGGEEKGNKWRDDYRCGPNYPLADGSPSECNPDGIYPCCSPYDWCGNTAAHCSCPDCIDYSGGGGGGGGGGEDEKPWRDDYQCGPNYPLADGSPSECNPDGIYPCCSPYDWCGNTPAHCSCPDCIDYSGAGGGGGSGKKWRDDLRCGPSFPLADGSPAECDPNGIYPCCSPAAWCGNTAAHCTCSSCIDYTNGGGGGTTKRWRDDLRCGASFPLANGRPSECNPNGIYPCCSPAAWCGNTRAHCRCSSCIDYSRK
ncbi:uncharacterized protein [Ptychodera flava]|uniref:uncharacterized protein isoform X2 n=1 Tax=Ptychodera flava TaxID=63121 RepID=UPI003969DCA7